MIDFTEFVRFVRRTRHAELAHAIKMRHIGAMVDVARSVAALARGDFQAGAAFTADAAAALDRRYWLDRMVLAKMKAEGWDK